MAEGGAVSSGAGSSEGRFPDRKRRWLLVIVFLLLLAFGIAYLFANLLISKPLHVAKDTTYITEPLKSNGKQVDYFRRIELETYPSNMATADNGFRLLVQHLDLSPFFDAWQIKQFYEKLGLDPKNVQADMTCRDPYDYLFAYVESEDFDPAKIAHLMPSSDMSSVVGKRGNAIKRGQLSEPGKGDAVGTVDNDNADDDRPKKTFGRSDYETVLTERIDQPWTLKDLPMMAGWLKQNGPVLDLLIKAVRKPIFHVPLVRASEDDNATAVGLPSAQLIRTLARGLRARALYRVATGNIDGAIDDTVACQRLGRHIACNGNFIDLLVGIAVEGIGLASGIAGSLEHPPTKEQLQRLMRELDNLPPRQSLRRSLRIERYCSLDSIQRLATGATSLEEVIGSSDGKAKLYHFAVDWNLVARQFNRYYDEVVEGKRPQGRFTVGAIDSMLVVSRRARSKQVADLLCYYLMPDLHSVKEAVHRCQCSEQMQQIILAMLLYQRDHGRLPPAYSVDKNGNPLHSWRVLLLPYLGQTELYQKIRVDEPWDSEYNRQFHDQDVSIYRCPSVTTAKPGQTTYSVLVGPEMPFQAGKSKSLNDSTLRKHYLILVVEREKPCGWMVPTNEIPQADADAGININRHPNSRRKLANGIAGPHSGGANFGFRDGAVRYLSETMDLGEFRKALRGTDKLHY